MTTQTTRPGRAIHEYFGLSYCNYLVLPRTLLQSMPGDWQQRFTAMLQELNEAFEHVPRATVYKVEAAEQHEVDCLAPYQLEALGISAEDGECRRDHDHDTDDGADCWPAPVYSDREGNELRRDELVLWPVPDPVPHYNRGRTYIQPSEPERSQADLMMKNPNSKTK
jgi:hypothetical protein